MESCAPGLCSPPSLAKQIGAQIDLARKSFRLTIATSLLQIPRSLFPLSSRFKCVNSDPAPLSDTYILSSEDAHFILLYVSEAVKFAGVLHSPESLEQARTALFSPAFSSVWIHAKLPTRRLSPLDTSRSHYLKQCIIRGFAKGKIR